MEENPLAMAQAIAGLKNKKMDPEMVKKLLALLLQQRGGQGPQGGGMPPTMPPQGGGMPPAPMR